MKKINPLTIMLAIIALSFIVAFLLHPGANENKILNFTNKVGTKNKGELLNPLIDFQAMVASKATNKATNKLGQWQGSNGDNTVWSIVYGVNGECLQNCRDNLQKLVNTQIRLDKYANRFRLYLVGIANIPIKNKIPENFTVLKVASTDWQLLFGKKHRLLMVDPRGMAILGYGSQVIPEDIFADSKFLIKNSK